MVYAIDLEGFPGRRVVFTIVDSSKTNVDLSSLTYEEGTTVASINADCVVGWLYTSFKACMKTINREETGKRFITGNINKEIIYSLSPTKNLKEAMQIFAATKESSFVLLASLEKEDYITPFIQKNHIPEETDMGAINKEKTEAVRNQLIAHFGISQEELAIYPFNDLIQMGVSMKNV